MYSFDVSLDKQIPSNTNLILRNLSDNEDFEGNFTNHDNSPKNLSVSAYFESGKTYNPEIIAESNSSSQNGSCNSGAFGIMILLAGVFLAKRH